MKHPKIPNHPAFKRHKIAKILFSLAFFVAISAIFLEYKLQNDDTQLPSRIYMVSIVVMFFSLRTFKKGISFINSIIKNTDQDKVSIEENQKVQNLLLTLKMQQKIRYVRLIIIVIAFYALSFYLNSLPTTCENGKTKAAITNIIKTNTSSFITTDMKKSNPKLFSDDSMNKILSNIQIEDSFNNKNADFIENNLFCTAVITLNHNDNDIVLSDKFNFKIITQNDNSEIYVSNTEIKSIISSLIDNQKT